MTMTAIDPIQAAQQIADKAQTELSTLQDHLPPLQQKVVDLQTEEATLTQNIETRKTHLATLNQSLQTAHTAHTDAVTYASVASGTIGEMDAIKTAVARKNELDAMQKQHNQTALEHAIADEQDQTRLAVIHSEHEETMKALHDLHERIRSVEKVKQQSLAELGEHLHTVLSKEYQAYRAHTEEARAALVAVQMDEHAFLTQAAEQMNQWSDHKTFREALGTDSPLIRILQAELTYLDQIITDSQEAVRQIAHPNMPVLPRNTEWNWHEVLTIPPQEMFYAGFGSEKTVETMKKRRERVASFLDQCVQMVR